MNSHNNLKRRRPPGGEDAPGLVTQDLSSASALCLPPVSFTEQELQILSQAASILNCPVSTLTTLDKHPRRQPADPFTDCPAPKRTRLPDNISPMSAPEKSPPLLSTDERPRHLENGSFSLGVSGARLASYFASVSFCPPCTTCEPSGYGPLPTTSPFDYGAKNAFLEGGSVPEQPWTVPQAQSGISAYHDHVPSRFMPEYHSVQSSQPMTMQPSTREEAMTYQHEAPDRRLFNGQETSRDVLPGLHVIDTPRPIDYRHQPFSSHGSAVPRFNAGAGFSSPDGEGSRISCLPSSLDIVSDNQRPPPAKRGPFKTNAERENTAETRKIGSCIRCRMQRIRCEINPNDKTGTCLTCSRVSNVRIWRVPCLRYKITDIKLFKPGQVKGYEWTRRWAEGIPDDISQWASSETREVGVTEGYTPRPVRLRVRRFVPQEGDALERTWVFNGRKKSVKIPPYAIVNMDEARATYTEYINEGVRECCRSIVSNKDKLISATYGLALSLAVDESTDRKERDLLIKVLRLWMAIRMTTTSSYIIGQERLGMDEHIMDSTSPLYGRIPLPPVMGAQIELVLIHQLQSKWRRELLDGLQVMTQASNHSTWLTTYIVTFMLLHNVSLLCQHDAGYARKHGIKTRFAREEMVREYQLGANILLAYFHYCNKGIHPFSTDCKDQDLSSLAKLDTTKIKFVQRIRAIVNEQKDYWQKIRQNNDYEHDFFFISQLYEENWTPQPIMSS